METSQTSNQIQKTDSQKITSLVKDKAIMAKFAQYMPQKDVQAFLGSLVALTQSNTNFRNIEPMSVLASAQIAAQCHVSIIPTIGEAAIIPYGNKAQFQIMTNGLVQLAMRSGQVASINATEIYADEFNGYDKIKGELNPLKEHDPKNTEVAGYAAYVRLINGGEHTEYWPKSKVEEHRRKFSKAKNSPWDTNFDGMAKKTVLKYTINHYCPKSTQMQTAIDADQATTTFGADGFVDLTYSDNPNTPIEVQFSEEEQAEREGLLAKLESVKITADLIVRSVKDAKTIDDVPTQFLRDLVKQEVK